MASFDATDNTDTAPDTAPDVPPNTDRRLNLLALVKQQDAPPAVTTNKQHGTSLDLSAPVYPSEEAQSQRITPGVDASITTPGGADGTSATPGERPKRHEPAIQPAGIYEKEITAQVRQLDSEANFTRFTRNALNRDADRFPPRRNDLEGTTTYTLEQVGLTDRDLTPGDTSADHFKRQVTITVPDHATTLKDCQFEFGDRTKIGVEEFDSLLDQAQKRQKELSNLADPFNKLQSPADMSFYTHGIRTGAEAADFTALALQLTTGQSVVNVDWDSTPPSKETYGLTEAYNLNRAGAAASYPRFEKELDAAIEHLGAEKTDMIAFSHGALFDTKYLQHRREIAAPKLSDVVFSHPDVPITTMQPRDGSNLLDANNRLYTNVALRTHVVGSRADLAMTGAAHHDCQSAPEGSSLMEKWSNHNRQMEINARLGNGTDVCRTLVTGHGGTYILETIPAEKTDFTNHFVNMGGISTLLNANQVTTVAEFARPGG